MLLVEGLFESWLFAIGNPFFLIFLAVSLGLATQRPSRAKALTGVSLPVTAIPVTQVQPSGLTHLLNEHVPESACDFQAGIPVPSVVELPPAATLAEGVNTTTGASSRRGAATLVDQAFSSLQNYLILTSSCCAL